MVELPNLEGQPPWVVIVVVLLFVVGTLGTIYLRRNSQEPPEETPSVEDAGAKVSLPAGTPAAPAFDPVREVIGHLATSAAKNAEDADRAEEEAKMWREKLSECSRELAVLQERHRTLEERLRLCEERSRYRGQGTDS